MAIRIMSAMLPKLLTTAVCTLAWAVAAVPAVAQGRASCAMPSPEQLAQTRQAVGRNLLATSRAVARVHTEGTLPHQGIRDESLEAEKDWPLMRQLALLWQAEHRTEDAAALARLLGDWAKTYRPSFNPIDETNLDAFLDAYAGARGALDAATEPLARGFVRALGEGYLQQLEAGFRPNDGRWLNNWNAHRVKMATLAAAALDDPALWTRAKAAFIAHLGRNLRADGSALDFEERDALHYVVYDLEPLVRAAQIASWRGEDWLSLKGNTGASVASALDWLLPYAKGERPHTEFVHSRVKFDAERAAAGVPGYAGAWNPATSAKLYAMAASLDARYAELAQRLNPQGVMPAPCWAN
jgi:hypothetical protein